MTITMQTNLAPCAPASAGRLEYTRRSRLSSDNGREVIGKCYQPRGGDQGAFEEGVVGANRDRSREKILGILFLRDFLAPRGIRKFFCNVRYIAARPCSRFCYLQ
jgi:hypothetical protein